MILRIHDLMSSIDMANDSEEKVLALDIKSSHGAALVHSLWIFDHVAYSTFSSLSHCLTTFSEICSPKHISCIKCRHAHMQVYTHVQ